MNGLNLHLHMHVLMFQRTCVVLLGAAIAGDGDRQSGVSLGWAPDGVGSKEPDLLAKVRAFPNEDPWLGQSQKHGFYYCHVTF